MKGPLAWRDGQCKSSVVLGGAVSVVVMLAISNLFLAPDQKFK